MPPAHPRCGVAYGPKLKNPDWLGRLVAPFAWGHWATSGAWRYQINDVTGQRRAIYAGAGHSPLHEEWLQGGAWSRVPVLAPTPPAARTPTPCAPSETHRARVDLAAVQLRNLLVRQADAGCASPHDVQLLAALDRWSAGELV